MRARAWLWTLNNPNNNETVIDLENLFSTQDIVRYAIFQLEQGEKGTLHYQGYVELTRPQRLSWMKGNLLRRAHWENRRGTRVQARDYCQKEESRVEGPWEVGDWLAGGQGARTDITALKRRVTKGDNIRDIIFDDCSNHQQARFVQLLKGLSPIGKDYVAKEVRWYWGPTGTGKTRAAMQESSDDVWFANLDASWFDGYIGQKDVLIDDIRAKNWPYVLMLRLLDGYKLRLPVKGGFTIWEPERIWITAPLKPESLYAGQLEYNGSIEQLLRRITVTTKFIQLEQD